MTKIKRLVLIVLISFIFIPSHVLAYQAVILGPSNEVVKYKEGKANNDTVFSVLKKMGVPYIDEGDKYPDFKGCYITSIAGFGMKQTNGWVYTVNGTSPMVSASEYKIKDTDKIIWCAYNNVDNINNYTFPELEQKDDQDTIIQDKPTNVKSSVEEKLPNNLESNNLVENEYSSNVIESFVAKEEYADLYNQLNSVNYSPKESLDYRNLGYIGILISFVLGISLYKFIRKENYNGKDKE